MEPFCLPFPVANLRKFKGKSAVLPGAPEAFLDDNEFTAYTDTRELGEWCATSLALREGISKDIDAYFRDGPGKEVGSFASFPLRRTNVDRTIDKRIGVLNIHRNSPGIFGNEARVEKLFLPAVTPFQLLLCDILLLRYPR